MQRLRVSAPLVPAGLAPVPALAGMQSALAPAGEDASRLFDIALLMFIGGGLIFVAVMALAGIALFGPQRLRAALGRRVWVVGGGILFPAVALCALLVYTLLAAAPSQARPALRVEVTGELWWWRIKYLDPEGRLLMETANEIRIPVGAPVEVLLRSDNVIHSFWVPNLAGKIDLIPGHVNRQHIRARTAGVYRGQCAEYCGAQHAQMALYVIALEPAAYRAWLDGQMRPASQPDSAFLRQGRQLFIDNRCAQCHTIRGTSAAGGLGPDLTHVGSRLSIAGGILQQNPGTIAGWIADTQRIKPGSRMPAYAGFDPQELRALSAYLASLR